MSSETTERSNGEKHFLCDDFDLWANELRFFELDQQKVMVWRDPDEDLHAYTAICDHQDRDLEETGQRECMCGTHDDETTLTCSAHSWEFDLETGESANPSGGGLNEYEIGIEDEEIFVVIPEEN